MNLGGRLKELRKSQGMTQQELAEKVHLSRHSLSKWETNKSVHDIYTILLLTDIYGVNLEELLGEDKAILSGDRSLEDTEKNDILRINEDRRLEEMLDKRTKKFLLVSFIVCVVLLLSLGAKAYYDKKEYKKTRIDLYGVEKVVYDKETSVIGIPVRYIKEIHLSTGQILEKPDVNDLEQIGVFQKSNDKKIRVSKGNIIGYFAPEQKDITN